MGKRTWTDGDIDYLRKHYPAAETLAIAKELGKTYRSVRAKAKVLKLRKVDGFDRQMGRDDRWSKKEDAFLRKNYESLTAVQLAEKLSRTKLSVKNRARLLGLRKSTNSGCFKPGSKPWNSGKQIESHPNSRKTQFRKGQLPHNTLSDGDVTVRKDSSGRYYYHYRVSKGVWKHYHVVIWEKANGPVPEGKMVAFKNKNSLDVRLENLELISRQENMARNTIVQYPIDIQKAMRAISKLTKLIKDAEE